MRVVFEVCLRVFGVFWRVGRVNFDLKRVKTVFFWVLGVFMRKQPNPAVAQMSC